MPEYGVCESIPSGDVAALHLSNSINVFEISIAGMQTVKARLFKSLALETLTFGLRKCNLYNASLLRKLWNVGGFYAAESIIRPYSLVSHLVALI